MTDCSAANNAPNILNKDTSLSFNDTNQSSNSTSVSSDLSRSNDTNYSNENAQASALISSNIPNSSSQACLADATTSVHSNAKFNLEEFIKQQLQTNLKDRYFMLQTEKCLVDLIKDEKNNTYSFPSMNPYYRMFVHRISEYFGLGHNLDQVKQCVIVNKTNTTKLPSQSFMAIIKSAEASASADQSTLASPNSPSSPALDSNQEDSSNQITQKKQILKREVNKSNQDFQNMKKPVEPMKTKTYEEKSADYIRIKNRIFNNTDGDDNAISSASINSTTTSNTNQQFTILANQQKSEQIKQQNSKQIKTGKHRNNTIINNNKNKNKPANFNVSQAAMNGTNGYNSENFPINYSNHHVPAQTYQIQPQADNYYNRNQQTFKMNTHQMPLLNDPYNYMYSNQHQTQPLPPQQQQHLKFNQQQQQQNVANISKQQTFSSRSYNPNTMNHQQSQSQPQPHHPSQMPPPPQIMHSNNLPYNHYSQMPLHPPPPLQPPTHTAPPQMHIHPAQYYSMNGQSSSTATSVASNVSTNFNSQQSQQQQQQPQNAAYYQPSYSREQLPLIDQNNTHQFFTKQHQYPSQSQMYLNPIQFHQVSNMNAYHGAIAQAHDYASQPINMAPTPLPLTTTVVSMPSNSINPQQNLTLSSSSSSSLQHPKSTRSMRADCYLYPSPHLDDKQHVSINNHNGVPYFNNNCNNNFKPNAAQSNDSNLKLSASFSSLPMNNYSFHNMAYNHNKLTANYTDIKSTNNRKVNKHYNSYVNNNRGYNHSNSGLNLNKYQKVTPINGNNKDSIQELTSDSSAEANEKQADSASANSNNNFTDQCISFQVYNLKQNLTKQMLNDLLKPYVVSIDFKPTNPGANPTTMSVSDNHSIINEENENVFIQFENIDKLHEAFKSFNLNEKDLMNESNLVASASNEHSSNNSDNSTSNDNNNNNTTTANTTEHIKEQHDTPFLLKQIIIC